MPEVLGADATSAERAGTAIFPHAESLAISIKVVEASTRFSLRLPPTSAVELGNVGSFRLDLAINTCTASGNRISARLGPDEWLLLAPRAEHSELARDLDSVLAGRFFSIVDISDRNSALTVSGLQAREVINGGCPLDLHDDAFPAGCATRTVLGKAEIVLLRPSATRSYRIECWRSFAPYVHALLREVAREFDTT